MKQPKRGFPQQEFLSRTNYLQSKMDEAKVDAVMLTTEPNVRYYSGFLTQFWQSPTRPWFLVIPREGKPIAVIPEIGASGMAQTWVDDIRTWSSPRPYDDGVSLLVELLRELPKKYTRVGMPMGAETYIRMPLVDLQKLQQTIAPIECIDVGCIIQQQRMVKSALEIEKIGYICEVASSAFETISANAVTGQTETQIVQNFKVALLNYGADSTPYVVAGSGEGGYNSIIMGPTDRILNQGDVLIIDTGSTFDGYYCDFDRNWAFGYCDDRTKRAYQTIWQATEAGFKAAVLGATTSDICLAMNEVMQKGGSLGNEVGRLGHGLGIELTEQPSNTPVDNTVIKSGMVLTLEPGMFYVPGKQMVHEENIVITDDGARWLTQRAAPEIPVL